ncbi:MAG TPA: NADH-quinone oxidoreductase subunit N [Candidatus Lambdaproteobacteria bacterium]|nr:NADH-quinone oxidoreductase subunit N [Deltaproteobacteria bacterium]HIB45533.1 NADH-quinone oxidoreductase subunit N [Candidatus Lambdaproteobacteria bacterium]HIB93379.1 NADH-quinone oxidoreductase subunit N [Candidatus Lambdaproteobacteria bacterium]HIO61558.1 NADH-quinone oxidoreductase subunit N [Deltaproteobacteria bacterium]
MEFISFTDLTPIIPEIIVLLTAFTVLLVDLFALTKERSLTLAVTTIIGLLLAMLAETLLHGKDISGFYGTVVADDFSILFEFIYMSVAIVTVFVSRHYIEENEMNFGEYYVLLLTAVSGMMFMTSGLDLLVIFIGLEIMSISSYILVGMKRKVAKANEAALKYLLLGAFSTGFLLYGISLLYGATGSTLLPTIITEIQQNGADNPLVIVGMALVVIAMSFKIAIVPFHMWTPDVYTGAPTPVTGFLSGAAKAAGFAVFIRVLMTGIPLDGANWENLLWLLAVLTMTVGNVMALRQNEVKRMLAYSSIAHAGYVMVAVVVGSTSAISGVIFYSCAYALMGTGAFGILTIRDAGRIPKTFDDLAGYGKRNPLLALLMTLFIFSLVGLPLTGGFIGKLQIFSAALQEGWIWLTVIGILNSALSVYYYLRVVMFMYMREGALPEGTVLTGKTSGFAFAGLIGTAVAVLYLGVFPDQILELASLSILALL